MNTLIKKKELVFATKLWFADHKFYVLLADGRELAVPIDRLPRLGDANDKQRENWRFIGGGQGIHWKDIDEDISVAGLLGPNY